MTLKFEEVIKVRKYCHFHCQWVYETFFMLISFNLKDCQPLSLNMEKKCSTINKYLMATNFLFYNFNNLKSLSILLKMMKSHYVHVFLYTQINSTNTRDPIVPKTLSKRIQGWIWQIPTHEWFTLQLGTCPEYNCLTFNWCYTRNINKVLWQLREIRDEFWLGTGESFMEESAFQFVLELPRHRPWYLDMKICVRAIYPGSSPRRNL